MRRSGSTFCTRGSAASSLASRRASAWRMRRSSRTTWALPDILRTWDSAIAAEAPSSRTRRGISSGDWSRIVTMSCWVCSSALAGAREPKSVCTPARAGVMLAAAKVAHHVLRLAHFNAFFMRCFGQFGGGASLVHGAGPWPGRRSAALAARRALTGRACRLRYVSELLNEDQENKITENLAKNLALRQCRVQAKPNSACPINALGLKYLSRTRWIIAQASCVNRID